MTESFVFSLDMLPDFARDLVKDLKPGDVVTLRGPLAAGKTTVVAALARALGYQGHVASPTFVIERRYPLKGPITTLAHLDFYRLENEQIDSLDWRETFNEPKTVTFIEWPERLGDRLPKNVKSITLEIVDEKTRRLTLSDNFTA